MKTIEQATRAYRTLDFIEAHPEKHDQYKWITAPDNEFTGLDKDRVLAGCGTTACYAGWDAMLEGQTFESYGYLTGHRSLPAFTAQGLGLTGDEAGVLFYTASNLAEVRKTVFDIFGPRPDGAV